MQSKVERRKCFPVVCLLDVNKQFWQHSNAATKRAKTKTRAVTRRRVELLRLIFRPDWKYFL